MRKNQNGRIKRLPIISTFFPKLEILNGTVGTAFLILCYEQISESRCCQDRSYPSALLYSHIEFFLILRTHFFALKEPLFVTLCVFSQT